MCSTNILRPIKIRIIPPRIVALLFNKSPNFFPINTPIIDNPAVITPIDTTAKTISTFNVANDIPTANASIEVATP